MAVICSSFKFLESLHQALLVVEFASHLHIQQRLSSVRRNHQYPLHLTLRSTLYRWKQAVQNGVNRQIFYSCFWSLGDSLPTGSFCFSTSTLEHYFSRFICCNCARWHLCHEDPALRSFR